MELADTEREQLLATAEIEPLPVMEEQPLLTIEKTMGRVAFVEGGALNLMKVNVMDVPALQLGLLLFWTMVRVRAEELYVTLCRLMEQLLCMQVMVVPKGNVITKLFLMLMVSVRVKVKVSPPAKLLTPMAVVRDDWRLKGVRVCAVRPEIREVFVFMAFPKLSQVETVRVSACSVVGGANNPLMPMEITPLEGMAAENKVEMVTMWEEYCPWHCMVVLLISGVSPQHESAPLMGIKLLLDSSLAHRLVAGNSIVTMPLEGTGSAVVSETIISLVRLTTPPMKEMLAALRALAEQVTSAMGESLEISVPMVPMNALVVTAEGGLMMLSKMTSTSLTKSLPENKLLMVMVVPLRAQEAEATELRLTITLLHENPLSWEAENWEGKMMVAVAEEGTKEEFQSVGLRTSSQLLARLKVQEATALTCRSLTLICAELKVKAAVLHRSSEKRTRVIMEIVSGCYNLPLQRINYNF